jgi:hypothetical protein
MLNYQRVIHDRRWNHQLVKCTWRPPKITTTTLLHRRPSSCAGNYSAEFHGWTNGNSWILGEIFVGLDFFRKTCQEHMYFPWSLLMMGNNPVTFPNFSNSGTFWVSFDGFRNTHHRLKMISAQGWTIRSLLNYWAICPSACRDSS